MAHPYPEAAMLDAGVNTDFPTELMTISEIQEAHPDKRLSSLMVVCLVADTVFAVTLALLGLSRGATGNPDVGWLIGCGACLMSVLQGTFFVGLRDWANQRNKDVEERMQAFVQCETFRIEQGQTQIRQQVALLRSEMVALLEPLPKGVIRYGDERDEEGEERAITRLAAASGDGADPVHGRARVTPIRPVHRTR